MGRGFGRRGWLCVLLAFTLFGSWAAMPAKAETAQFEDPADDAYRYPQPVDDSAPPVPNPLLSNDAADVVIVRFFTAPETRWRNQRAYTVSVTVSGAPHETFNYLVGGRFAGEDCFLIHFLRAGETRDAIARCGWSSDSSKLMGSIAGSKVTIKGQTISATFSFFPSTLPEGLRQEPEISELYVLTCPVTKDWWGCNDDVLDYANSDSTFRL